MNEINKEEIISILKECYDPEIPIDLWNLGCLNVVRINNTFVLIYENNKRLFLFSVNTFLCRKLLT